ncbi:B- and T-lymphocyte attenuator-like [Notolabrus celidotus]|uniref:B- and T-lymphocyte attenuator-like n=1 Tax=Notolabrus celidotus TaxID=1203425 RepID=UPI0014903D70|nr:B- and T-lymphocyte attenuator-like [Notolabrus celidotus]
MIVPIMRPQSCWTLLLVSILAALLLTLNADSKDECDVQVKVPRNTRYNTFLWEDLRINCTVTFCKDPPPEVSWYKIEQNDVPVNFSGGSRFRAEWKRLEHLKGVSFLTIQKVVTNDSGVYRCQSGSSVGYNINVSVSDRTDSDPGWMVDLWTYGYIAAGITAFVIIVIVISVASMQGCKGKSKNVTQEDNQYAAIPMVEQPFPNTLVHPSPRGSPSVPLSQASTRRKKPPHQPSRSPGMRDNECVYSKVKGDRHRQRNTADEEGGSVVYAALNHQVPARAPARPRRQMEETSEYAAIRIKDPNCS